MWSTWLNDSTMPALEQSIVFAQRRHAVLAGNIANKDVPGYQTRDLSVSNFQQALRSSVEASKNPEVLSPGLGDIASAPSRQAIQERVRDTQSQVLYLDGSDVSFEHQITEISKNALMHETAIALMRSQFQTLQVAIRESVNV